MKKTAKLKLSPLYLLMALVMFLTGSGQQFVVYTAVVILHELAHAQISERLGYSLIGFKLMPYGASLTGSFEGVKPRDEVLIAAAGPSFNILLAIPAVALWWLVPESYYFTQDFVFANIFIAAFNVLPVFPLDGGRILLALTSQKTPRNVAYRRVRICGFIFSAIFIGLFILTFFYKINLSFGITGLFMLFSTIIPDKNSYYQRLYSMAYKSGRIKNGLVVKEIMVSDTVTVLKLSKLLNGNFFTRFTVVGKDFAPVLTLTETDLELIYAAATPDECIIKAAKRLKK